MKTVESMPGQAEIKARVASLLGAEPQSSLPPARLSAREARQMMIGLALILIGMFVLNAGTYMPATDIVWRSICIVFAVTYSSIGVLAILLAKRQTEPKRR